MKTKYSAIIITIGDELLNGQTIDTNSAFIARQLNDIGISVAERIAISDDENHILETLKTACTESSIIIMTGGLGPTKDDITKKTIAKYFNVGYKRDVATYEHVKNIFEMRNRPFLDVNQSQADVPANCTVLFNKSGTAPGMWFNEAGVIYISMPGVPYEMKYLMVNEVIPQLKLNLDLPTIIHEHIQTVGIGESFLADKISDLENDLPAHIKLAYLPSFGIVHLRLTGKSNDRAALQAELIVHRDKIRERLGEIVFGIDEKTLQEQVAELLIAKQLQLGVAESCTGGHLSHLFTSIPGSSAYFQGGVVTYSYEMKHQILKVKNETLEKFGAVSEECVREMVSGLLLLNQVNIAVAISGIAGPGGGTEDKPVGTVWIAVGNHQKIEAKKFMFYKDRAVNIESSSVAAMEMIRRFASAM